MGAIQFIDAECSIPPHRSLHHVFPGAREHQKQVKKEPDKCLVHLSGFVSDG